MSSFLHVYLSNVEREDSNRNSDKFKYRIYIGLNKKESLFEKNLGRDCSTGDSFVQKK